ncbi:diguanylate cyclase [Pseudomonas putida]|nr:diguanylate cyclase [Pseudomonas putida]
MGAGLPANTGVARARQRAIFFAGKPAPTSARQSARSLH